MSKKPTKQDPKTQEAKKNPKFRFKNIGPIRDAQLELGDLTVIAGANNTGKTYIAYTLYGLLKYINGIFDIKNLSYSSILRIGRLFGDDFLRRRRLMPTSERRLMSISEEKILKVDIFHIDQKALTGVVNIDDAREFVVRKMKFICKDFAKNIGEVFSTSRHEFIKADTQWDIQFSERLAAVKDGFGPFQIETNPTKRSISITIDKESISMGAVSSYNIKTVIQGVLLGIFIGEKSLLPFILSAERFGISLFYKELDFTKNRVVEVLQGLKDGKNFDARAAFLINSSTARYAKPIKDNIDYTRDLEATQKEKGKLSDEKLHEYVKDIVGGYYRYENDTIYFISKQRKEGAFKIPLHLASSSAREMSDLYFYLKHVARKRELLIIDEPESHLSTKNQILMARFLVRCVNAGMRVLITTHSDYIIKEFNNLIMLSSSFPQKDKFLANHKKQYTKEDFLKPKLVRAYICKKGELIPCEMNSRGMLMPSFDDTIIDINRISDFLDSYLPEDA